MTESGISLYHAIFTFCHTYAYGDSNGSPGHGTESHIIAGRKRRTVPYACVWRAMVCFSFFIVKPFRVLANLVYILIVSAQRRIVIFRPKGS